MLLERRKGREGEREGGRERERERERVIIKELIDTVLFCRLNTHNVTSNLKVAIEHVGNTSGIKKLRYKIDSL